MGGGSQEACISVLHNGNYVYYNLKNGLFCDVMEELCHMIGIVQANQNLEQEKRFF